MQPDRPRWYRNTNTAGPTLHPPPVSKSVKYWMAAMCQWSCWRLWPENDSYKQKSNSSATGTNANDDVVRRRRYRMPLRLHLHGDPATEKPIIFPQCPCQVNWKRLSRCRMPGAGISSISHMPRHCYLLAPFVICIISMWQMGIIHSFPNKINWAFKGEGGHSCKKKTAKGYKKLNKSSDTETNKEVSRIWGSRALAMLWLPAPIRMWMGLDFRMKGLTGLVLQSKHCHTTRCFFFVFSRALLAAFGGGAGLILISLQPFFDGVWARWTQASYRPGGSRNEVVGELHNTSFSAQCSSLIKQSLMPSVRFPWITTLAFIDASFRIKTEEIGNPTM